MGKYDQFLVGLSSGPVQVPSPSSPKSAPSRTGKYDQFLSGLPPEETSSSFPDPYEDPFNFERSSNYPPSRVTDVSVPDAMTVQAIVSAPKLAYNLGKAGISGIGKLAGKIKDIRNAPKVLEDTMGAVGEKFGTLETPSMVGNTARASLESEQAANEALAQKLYERVPKDVPVSTPKLASAYQEIADELPSNIRGAVSKHVQLEPNPVRPNDIGTTNTKIMGKLMPDETPIIPHQYSASPGIPSQLPPNNPSVGDLIKLRSKLGAAARSGGIDGHNAGKLKAALDADIEALGSGGGPLGKMTGEVVNENLRQATNYYREMMQQQGGPVYKRLATGKIEDIPDFIFKNGRTEDVLAGRAALGEPGYQAVKKSFFNDIINSKDVGKRLAKYSENNSDFLPTVFNEQELRALRTVSDLQRKAIEAQKTVERAKMLMTGGAAAVVGGGIAGKAIRLGAE